MPNSADSPFEGISAERIEAIKHWVEYLESELPETWGPQQNAIVNAQIDAAQHVGTSAKHQQHVQEVTADILEDRDESEDASN